MMVLMVNGWRYLVPKETLHPMAKVEAFAANRLRFIDKEDSYEDSADAKDVLNSHTVSSPSSEQKIQVEENDNLLIMLDQKLGL
ncbi:Acyltransferase family protein [Sesbania bispinosa]|nr:Acyltransferase family protein [Sesbania bispinosa]